MSNILERIIQISENENITISKIERIIGASKGVLHKAIQNKTDISSKWIVLVVENFIQYNPDWLLTGKGEMLRKVGSGDAKENVHPHTAELVELQKKEILRLEHDLQKCKEQKKIFENNTNRV